MVKSQFGFSFPADIKGCFGDGGPGVAPEHTAHNSLISTGLEDRRGKGGGREREGRDVSKPFKAVM